MSHKILVVDDEQTLRITVRAYLEAEGYTVQTANNGRIALHTFRSFQPDLVVLDVMLPEMDGLEVLRQIRQSSEVYVIMLTARADEMDKVVGLTLGADDYIAKPFSPRELVARVKAALRRLTVPGSIIGADFSRLTKRLNYRLPALVGFAYACVNHNRRTTFPNTVYE